MEAHATVLKSHRIGILVLYAVGSGDAHVRGFAPTWKSWVKFLHPAVVCLRHNHRAHLENELVNGSVPSL